MAGDAVPHEIDTHLASVAAVAREREARIRQLEQKLEATNAEHDRAVSLLEARHDRLLAEKKKRLTDGTLKARHVALKIDLHRLRADAELAGDEKLLRKLAGLDRPAQPYLERERQLDQREQALTEREQPQRRKMVPA